MKMGRKGQEEMIGFVLIVVIVAVVFLVFLGIMVRQGGVESASDSTEVYQFLESSMEFTTECAVSFIPDYASLGELFEECYSGNNCLNGKKACSVLEETLTGVLDESWNIDLEGESSVKGFAFKSIYTTNSSGEGNEIISLEKGACEGARVKGASYLAPAFPGKIESSLRICS